MKTSRRLFYLIMSVKPRILSWAYGLLFSLTVFAQQSTLFFKVDTPIVHDPVLAYDKGLYHLYSTGEGIRHYVSLDLKHWKGWKSGVVQAVPSWIYDSVPEFKHDFWAPDVIKFRGRWYLTYSCSTFGKNTSAIGLLSNSSLNSNETWRDEGCIIASRRGRDNWNAIDPNVVVDQKGYPWLVFGSFWDGIQLVSLDSTLHIAPGKRPSTIARRYVPDNDNGLPRNALAVAGPNAIEAPFIFFHRGWYYLFVSWDYCCQGLKSTYRIAVGRSRRITGPYLDRSGRNMLYGGGDILLEGDRKEIEALGHCGVYDIQNKLLLVCHGYSIAKAGTPVLLIKELFADSKGLSVKR